MAMLATALFGGLARRITLRDGSTIDSESNPKTFWMFVGGCGFVGFALLIQALLNFR
ncbi:MAG: hypothetical protein ACRYG4_19365 [Janthinobacterium lividum]